MLVRRVRKSSFATISEHAKTVLGSKMTGEPQLVVDLGAADSQDIQALVAAWNKVMAKCKIAGMEGALDKVRVFVIDQGRFTAKFQKGRLAVNLPKFSKNAIASELLAHELGRRFWAMNLTEAQRAKLKASYKDPEGNFARRFRAKLFGKASSGGERWAEVTL